MKTCPPVEILSRLLSEERLDQCLQTAAEHVEQCPACQQQLEQLSEDQQLTTWRRASSESIESVDSPELQRALKRARELPTHNARTDETISDLELDLSACLSAPLVAGDLGSLGRYRVQRELGRGGMGVVFQAIDADLARPVALKLLRPDRNDATSRARFVREAQAAARVQHEHVVTVHAVINPAHGLPYLVMELLKGGTLDDWIQEAHQLDPKTAAIIAAQVADGLDGAHEAGLVHRDVKPSNVLLGGPKEGLLDNSSTIKIADFGLARVTNLPPGSTLTLEGVIAGTPAYMSPEQIAWPQRFDKRCDVYGLGVVLYEMLTGEVPFRGAPHTVLRQIELDEPLPPRRLNDAVPMDLETICLKAMAKEPDRRYQSARELADDLRRWLGGEPIHARPAGSVERLQSWARRNPRVAALAGTIFGLLLTLAVGSTVAAVWIAFEQRQTEFERLTAVRAGEAATRSAAVAQLARDQEAKQAAAAFAAERAARESAEAARAAEAKAKSLATAASEGRSIAMDSLGALVGKVYDRLGDTAGTIKLREELVQSAIDGLNRVSQNAEKDASLDRYVMLTHQRLGLIYIDAGRTADAIAQFRRSRELVERLLANDPGSAILERDLARAFGKLGDIAFHNLDDTAADDNYRQALAVYEAHFAKDPQNLPARDGLNITHNNLARLLERQGKLTAAREHAEKSLAIAEELAASQSDTRFQRGLVVTLSRVGLVCVRQYDFEAAGRHYRRQVELAEQLVAREPSNSTWLGDLSTSLQNFSKLLERQWAFGEAAELSLKSLALGESQAKLDPENAVAQRNLGISYNSLGDIQAHLDADAARASFVQALEITDEQARSDPTSVQKAADAIDCCAKLSALETRLGRYAEAATWIRRGHEQLDRLVAAIGEVQAPTLLEWKMTSLEELAAYETAVGAIHDPASWRELSPVVQARLERLRALDLARAGRHADAASAADKLLKRQPPSSDDQAAAGAVYSNCIQAVERLNAVATSAPTPLTAEQTALRDAYIQAAIDAARRLFQADPSTLQLEYKIVEFDPLRALPAYASMLVELRHAANAESK